jgi:hypothetical protein
VIVGFPAPSYWSTQPLRDGGACLGCSSRTALPPPALSPLYGGLNATVQAPQRAVSERRHSCCEKTSPPRFPLSSRPRGYVPSHNKRAWAETWTVGGWYVRGECATNRTIWCLTLYRGKTDSPVLCDPTPWVESPSSFWVSLRDRVCRLHDFHQLFAG